MHFTRSNEDVVKEAYETRYFSPNYDEANEAATSLLKSAGDFDWTCWLQLVLRNIFLTIEFLQSKTNFMLIDKFFLFECSNCSVNEVIKDSAKLFKRIFNLVPFQRFSKTYIKY